MSDRLPKTLPKPLRIRVADERRRDGDARPPCKCGHSEGQHQEVSGKVVCWNVVCGCAEFRADDGTRWTPARFRDEYDPSPYGVDRRTR